MQLLYAHLLRRALAASVVIGILLHGSIASAQTATERAASYLTGSADPRGSWGAAREATALRDTATVLRALAALGRDEAAVYHNGAAWLADERRKNTDDTARAIRALDGTALEFAVDDDRATLLDARIDGAGWGLGFGDSASSALDTSLASGALFDVLDFETLIDSSNAVVFEQNLDGGWGVESGASLVGVTSEVVLYLTRVDGAIGAFYVLAAPLDNAVAYLAAAQQADGRIGPGPLETALAVRALLASGRPVAATVNQAITFLALEQLADGSWEGDPYTTAEAVLAIRSAGPNLTVDPAGALFLPASPVEGDLVTISFAARNTGATAAATFVVRVFRGDPAAGRQVGADQLVTGLAAGAATPLAVTANTTGLTGGQTYTIVVDADAEITEANEDDNASAYWTALAPRAAPDLVVTLNDVHFVPDRVGEGDPVDLTVAVRNVGDDPVASVDVQFFDGDPALGGTLLGTETLAAVPAHGAATATVPGQTFVRGIFPIHVVVDPANTVTEASEANNHAFRPLVVTEHVDLVVTNADLDLSPGNLVTEGTAVLVTAAVRNDGTAPAVDVVLRLENTGEAVQVGTIPGGGTANAVFSFDTLGQSGFVALTIRADPTDQLSELDETNNVGAAFLEIAPLSDLSVGPLAPVAPVTEGGTVTLNATIFNQGETTATNVPVSVFEGVPGFGGVRVTPDLTLASLGGGQPGLPGARIVLLAFSTTALSLGTHTLYVVVDADNVISEADDANNLTPFVLVVQPKPDLSVTAATVSATPAAPEEGDSVEITATVQNLQPTAPYLSAVVSWRVALYDGTTAGPLLAEQRLVGFGFPVPFSSVTLTGTLDTAGRVGTNPITIVADPEGALPDRDRANNTFTYALVVGAATTPDPAVSRTDVAVTPARFATGQTVTLNALLHNERPVAAPAVPVSFYLGDPDAGGTLLGTTTVALPAAGTTLASVSWNTTGVSAGDVGIHVVIDRDHTLAEGSEENNQAARGVEVGLPDTRRPTGFTATPNGPGAELAWTAPPTAVTGYYPLRDADLAGLPSVASPRVSATADTAVDENTPDKAIDSFPASSLWQAPNTGMPHYLEVDLGAKRYVRAMKPRFSGLSLRARDFDLQTFDGVSWVTQVAVRGNDFDAPPAIVLPTATKTRKVRLVILTGSGTFGTTVGVTDLGVTIAQARTTLAFADTPVLAGSYGYSVTGADALGIESRPSDPAAAVVTSVPAPTPASAVVTGNNVALSWAADPSGRRTGVYVRRDGAFVNSGAGETDITATASWVASQPFPAAPIANTFDGVLTTYERPPLGSSPPWVLTATLPARRPVVRVDLAYPAGAVGTSITIDTWDGASWVTQVTVPVHPGGLGAYTFAPVTTDRVRVVVGGANSTDGVPHLQELHLYARTPLAATATSFTNTAVPAGAHSYDVVAADALGQDGVATVGATIGTLPQVTGVTASVAGRDVTVGWTALGLPNVAGYRVFRDGRAVNAPNTATNLALTAAAVGSSGSANAAFANDGATGTGWTATPSATTDEWVELALPTARRVRRVQAQWGTIPVGVPLDLRVEAWDGTRWVAQHEAFGFSGAGNRDYTFPTVVETTRVRLFLPRQPRLGSLVTVLELRVFGEALVTGTSFTETGVPDGTFAYQVAGVDLGGSQGPLSDSASATVGTTAAPTGLVATLLAGGDVALTWTASTGAVAGYHLYRNGVRLTPTPLGGTSTTHHLVLSGEYLFEVSAVSTAGFETARSAPAGVSYTDVSPPSAPTGLHFVTGYTQIAWTANPAVEDVVGYRVTRADGPAYLVTLAALTGATSFTDAGGTLFGITRFTYRVAAVDASGLLGPEAEVVATRPVPVPPTALVVATTEAQATVTFTPSVTPDVEAYTLRRDAAFAAHTQLTLTATASTAALSAAGAVNIPPSAVIADTAYWESTPTDAAPYLEITGTFNGAAMIPVDRVHLRWLSPAQRAVAFTVRAELFDGAFVTLATVTGNTALEQTFDVPHVVARAVRVIVTEKVTPGSSVGLFTCDAFYASRASSGTLFDNPAPPGLHSYAALSWDVAGQRSPDSAAVIGAVADVDLVVTSEDLRFSQDTVAVGDAVTITASVRNAGVASFAGTAAVELYLGNPATGGTLLGTGSLSALSPGGRVDLAFPWTVTFGPEDLYVSVDRTGAVAEREEDNNVASRGAPYSLPYRSYTYTKNLIIPFAYTSGTQLLVREAATGHTVYAGTLAAGAHPQLAVPEGVYHVSGTEKFSVYVGGVDVVGQQVIDQESRGLSTEFYTLLGFYAPGFNHVITWAVEDDTEVTITNADTAAVLYHGVLDAGEHAQVSDLTLALNAPVFVHLVASKAVTALSLSDLGYAAADVRGRFAGTDFHTALQVKPDVFSIGLFQLNVYAYQDDTFVRVTNEATGEELFAGTLDRHEVTTIPHTRFVSSVLTYLHIEASNNVSADVRPYAAPGGDALDESGAANAASGTGIGTRLLEIAQPIARGTGDFNVVFSYYDDTVVTVEEVARADDTTPRGIIATVSLDDGEFLNLGRDPAALDTYGEEPGRLLEVRASHPVTGRFGGGLAAANFMPVLFGSANDPDLEVREEDLTLSTTAPVPGDIFTITARVHNVGARAAEAFPVDIYDGDPARGGVRLQREFVPILIPGDELVVAIPYELTTGFHDIYLLADPEGVVAEADDNNNTAHLLIATPADLVPAITSVTPAAPLTGETLTVQATITNAGGAHLDLLSVELFDGDPTAGGVAVASTSLSLMAGEERAVTFTWDTHGAAAGAHTLFVRADGAHLVDESDETNNVATTDVSLLAPDYDDLALVAVVLVPGAPYAGTTATAEVTVENRGRLIGPTAVQVLVDGLPAGSSLLPPLATAASVTLAVPIVAGTVGPHSLLAVVDPDLVVAEADESNNAVTAPFTVGDPALLLDVALAAPSYGAGEDAGIAVTLTNLDGARTGTLDVVVRDAVGTSLAVLATAQPVSLAALASATVPLVWNTGTAGPGSYTVEATVQQGGSVVAVDTATVLVTADTPVALGVATDHASYGANQEVVIFTHVAADAAGNQPLADVPVVTEVVAPDGLTIVFTATHLIDVTPGSEADLFATWPIGTALPGTYTARSTALGVTAVDPFTVGAGGPAAVAATMTVAPQPVAPGTPLVVAATVTNHGATDLLGATIAARLVDGTTATVVAAQLVTADLLLGAPAPASFSFDIDALPPDHAYLAVVAVSHGGAPLTLIFQPWEIGDLEPPSISVSGVSDGQCSTPPVTPLIAVTDATAVTSTITLDGVAFVSGTPVTSDGTHVLAVHAEDAFGNTAAASVTFVVDGTAPLVALTGVSAGQVAQEVTAGFTATDANLVATSFLLDGAPYVAGTAIASEGDHTLTATASDCAGHLASRTVAFVIDRTAPVIEVLGVTNGALVATDVTPVVVLTEPHPGTSSVTLSGAPFVSGTTVTADGAYTLAASATDAAGNTATAVVVTFAIDRTAPAVTVAGVTNGQVAPAPLTITFGADDPHLSALGATLDGAPFVSGTTVGAEGPHTLVVTATDGAGNSTMTAVAFTIDTIPPTITVLGVTDGAVAPAGVTPVVTFDDATLATTTLTLDGAPFVSGTAVSAEGDHVLAATATDQAGHSTTVTVAFAIDTQAPVIALAGVTDGQCTATPVTPAFTITDAHLASTTAQLDGAPFTSGTTITAEGDHVLAIAAMDLAGHTSVASASFVVDTTAPLVTVAGVTEGQVSATSLTPTVDVSDAHLVAATTTLDGAPFGSGTVVSAEGVHTLTATADDCAGHRTTATVTFTLDATAPVVAVNGITDGERRTTPATITVTTNDLTPVTLTLTLDGAPCANGATVSAEGLHTFVATGTDDAGNSTTRTIQFRIDTTPPLVTVTGVVDGAAYPAAVTPTVTIDDADLAAQTVELDGVAFASGTTVAAEGAHELFASATDHAGNSTTVVVRFRIDATPPVIVISGVSDGAAYAAAVTPLVALTDADLATQTVTLDGAPFTAGTPVGAEGVHTLVAAASDHAGHSTTRSVTFTIDLTPPAIAIMGVVDGATYAAAVTPTVVITDADLATQSVTLDGAPFVSGTVVAADGVHQLLATATDRAGNSTSASAAFTISTGPGPGGGDVSATAPAAARVLIALETTADAPFLRATLDDAGLRYDTAFGRSAWLAALRTGRYNVVVVYRPTPAETGTAWAELRENVAAGVGLIFVKAAPDAMPQIGAALALSWGGKQKGAVSVTLAAPLGTGTVALTGDTTRLTLGSATSAGVSSKGDVVAAVAQLAAGRTVTLAWDPELLTSPALADLYLSAVEYVRPTAALVVAGGVVPLRASFTASVAGSYRLAVTLPTGATLVDATPAPDPGAGLEWTRPLAAGATFTVEALLRLPETAGPHPVTVDELYEAGGGYTVIATATHDYVVDADPVALASALLASLNALSLTGGNAAQRDHAVAALTTVVALPSTSADAALALLLDAAKHLAGITGVPTTGLRTDLGRLLRIWEVRSVL